MHEKMGILPKFSIFGYMEINKQIFVIPLFRPQRIIKFQNKMINFELLGKIFLSKLSHRIEWQDIKYSISFNNCCYSGKNNLNY